MLPDFSRIRVLVVGDVMIDRYLSGRVERISPEAPVPVILLGEEENRPGGAANVALNLKALGCRAGIAGAVGVDANADILRSLLQEEGIELSLVGDGDRCTTVKTRIISMSQQLLRADREQSHDLNAEAEAQLFDAISEALDRLPTDLLLLQDYNKGVLSASLIARILRLATDRGIKTVVDPKAKNFWAYRGVDLFKPNLREIQQQLDFPLRPDLADLDRAAQEIFGRLSCGAVMITLSEHGIYLNDGHKSAIYPTSARRIADVSGAGDTVISVAACGLAAGMSLPSIATLANLAGAQVIARPGVVAVDRGALEKEWSMLG